MNITIHRGTHRIGGCVTEYEYDGWHEVAAGICLLIMAKNYLEAPRLEI